MTIAADEYEDYLRYKSQRRSFATVDLSAEEVEPIAKTRMHPRHNHLNALLRRKKRLGMTIPAPEPGLVMTARAPGRSPSLQ